MTKITAPPIYEPLTNDAKNPVASLPWILFFNQLFVGDTGSNWIPTFVNLTTVGTVAITGKYYKLSQSIAIFMVTLTPSGGGSSSATAGSTYISNFPGSMFGNGFCLAVSGLLGSNAGMCDQGSNRVYPPSWTAVTVPLTIIGVVEAG